MVQRVIFNVVSPGVGDKVYYDSATDNAFLGPSCALLEKGCPGWA
jgi:hypothetical protein